MDFKLSDQLLSSRGKACSRVGWGVVASLIVLMGLFINNSIKGPVMGSLFQGFYSVSNVTVSRHSSSNPTGTAQERCFENAEQRDHTQAHLPSVSEIQDFLEGDREELVLEDGHLSDLIEGDRNGSYGVEGGTNQQTGHEADSFLDSNTDVAALEKSQLGNFSEIVNNATLLTENENADQGSEGKPAMYPSDANDRISENKEASNFLSNEEVGRHPGKEEKSIAMDDKGSPVEENKNANYDGESHFSENIEATNLSNSGEDKALAVNDKGNPVEENKAINSGGDSLISESKEASDLSNNGEVGKLPGGEEQAMPMVVNDLGNPVEENEAINSDSDSQVVNASTYGSFGTCDIFDGKWVSDDSEPYYPADSCPYIDSGFDCHRNGRPDDAYVKWKWQPNGCDIPRLNATDFLERLRGKRLVFVGDSLNRNMWESLVCILRHSVREKKRVYEISGRSNFRKKGVYAFRFEDYNCSVDFVVAPFLVRESSFKRKNGSIETLRLDLMDPATSMYHDADIMVFNTGHWWTHEKTSKGEDYYQEGNHVYPRLKALKAYQKALTTWAKWIDQNVDSSRTQVFFRGYSVTHFWGGQWNSGGQCHKETEPISNETHLTKYPSKMRALEHVIQEAKTPIIYLNISRLTDYRKDAHPSIYRRVYKTEQERAAAERSQDCSHWCLPGVPDTWNQLLYASLLKAGKGIWRN